MFLTLIGIAVLGAIWPAIRAMIGLVILGWLIASFVNSSNTIPVQTSDASQIMSYDQLVKYQPSCELKDKQLAELHQLQKIKNFKSDPDDLSDADRAYNSRLKATIWWYSYRCKQ